MKGSWRFERSCHTVCAISLRCCTKMLRIFRELKIQTRPSRVSSQSTTTDLLASLFVSHFYLFLFWFIRSKRKKKTQHEGASIYVMNGMRVKSGRHRMPSVLNTSSSIVFPYSEFIRWWFCFLFLFVAVHSLTTTDDYVHIVNVSFIFVWFRDNDK